MNLLDSIVRDLEELEITLHDGSVFPTAQIYACCSSSTSSCSCGGKG